MIIFNPTDMAVVYSEQGHILGGGERREVDQLDKHGQRSLDNGYIVRMDEDEESGDATAEAETTGEAEMTPPSKSGSRKRSTAAKNDGDSGASDESDGN